MTDSMLAAVHAAAGMAAAPGTSTTTTAPEALAAAPAAPPAPDVGQMVAQALAAERSRLIALDALAVPGFETALAEAKASGTTPGDFAVALVAGLKASGRLDAVAALTKAAAVVPPVAAMVTETGSGATAAPTGEEAWRAAYASTPAISAEFMTVEDYLSHMRRETRAR